MHSQSGVSFCLKGWEQLKERWKKTEELKHNNSLVHEQTFNYSPAESPKGGGARLFHKKGFRNLQFKNQSVRSLILGS